eukprot:4499259-Pyramimonas_sp.AAC.1
MAEEGRRAGAAPPARRLRGKQSPPDGGLGAICDLAISAEWCISAAVAAFQRPSLYKTTSAYLAANPTTYHNSS